MERSGLLSCYTGMLNWAPRDEDTSPGFDTDDVLRMACDL